MFRLALSHFLSQHLLSLEVTDYGGCFFQDDCRKYRLLVEFDVTEAPQMRRTIKLDVGNLVYERKQSISALQCWLQTWESPQRDSLVDRKFGSFVHRHWSDCHTSDLYFATTFGSSVDRHGDGSMACSSIGWCSTNRSGDVSTSVASR